MNLHHEEARIAQFFQAERELSEIRHVKTAILAFLSSAFKADPAPSGSVFKALAMYANDHAGPVIQYMNIIRSTVDELAVGLMDYQFCTDKMKAAKEVLDEFFASAERSAMTDLEENGEAL